MTNAQLEAQIKLAGEETKKGNYDSAQILAQQVIDILDKRTDNSTSTENGANTKDTKNSNDLSDEQHGATIIRDNAILALAWNNYKQGNLDIALDQAQRVLDQSNEGKITSSITNAWNIIGGVNISLGNYDKALEFFNNALDIHYELGEKSLVAQVTGNIGNVYYALGNYDKALEFYNNALALHYELGEKSLVAAVTGNIGSVYLNLGNYDKALEFFNNALDINYDLGEKSSVATVTGNIGNVYTDLGNYDKALEFYNNALVIHYDLGEKSAIARVTGNIGLVYLELGNYDKAFEFYNNALTIHYEVGEKSNVATVTGNIGSLYADVNYEGYDDVKAEEFIRKAIDLSSQIGAKALLVDLHKALAELYSTQGRWQEAYSHKTMYHQFKDEVQSEEAIKLADKLDYERKEAEREKQIATELARKEEREKIITELTNLNASLHEANRQKNEVIGIVAHDLKNPLAAILLTSETLKRYFSYLDKIDILDKLSKINFTAERMNLIIRNLLDIQKLETGKFTLALQPVVVSSILNVIINDYKDPANKKNILLLADIPNGSLAAHAEQTALHEVMDNLISNAVKYSPFDTTVRVSVEESAQTIRIYVQDEGPGLTDDDKTKLFGQFSRLSAKPTGGEHSTGLGLSIAQHLIEMMNGKIWCESEVGKGATFIVELRKIQG